MTKFKVFILQQDDFWDQALIPVKEPAQEQIGPN